MDAELDEKLIFDSQVKCDINDRKGKACNKDATYRAVVECSADGHQSHLLLCDSCMKDAKSGTCYCATGHDNLASVQVVNAWKL